MTGLEKMGGKKMKKRGKRQKEDAGTTTSFWVENQHHSGGCEEEEGTIRKGGVKGSEKRKFGIRSLYLELAQPEEQRGGF